MRRWCGARGHLLAALVAFGTPEVASQTGTASLASTCRLGNGSSREKRDQARSTRGAAPRPGKHVRTKLPGERGRSFGGISAAIYPTPYRRLNRVDITTSLLIGPPTHTQYVGYLTEWRFLRASTRHRPYDRCLLGAASFDCSFLLRDAGSPAPGPGSVH